MPNHDNSADKRVRKKHSSHRISVIDDGLESMHKPTHRHRLHKAGCIPRINASKDISDKNMNSNNVVYLTKKNGKRSIKKEINRLFEENRTLTMRLEGSGINPETVAELKEKDLLMLRICNKYYKLSKGREDLQQECERLNGLLTERETEYHLLHTQHKEFIETLQKMEKTKSNLLISNQRFKSENNQLNEDITLLKNVIYRLNEELERYQNKLRECGQNINVSKNIHGASDIKKPEENILESWGSVNTHVLGPLLDAYQENLSEKQELISKYEDDIINLSTRCKEIVAENEYMQSEMEKLKSQCIRCTDETKIMAEDADLLKELNECYVKQTTHQKQKIHEIHSLYEQKVETMSFDNNRLHEEYLASKTELSNLQGRYDILYKEYEKLQNDNTKTIPIEVHTAAVEECKGLLEKLKHQYETEKEKLSNRVKELEELQSQNKTQLDIITIEKSQSETSCKNLERDFKHMQKKLEHFKKAAHLMQVSRESFKKQLRKTTTYCEQLFNEYERIMSERDKLIKLLRETENENANIHFLSDTITQRVGHLKEQLTAVQKEAKEQLAIAEKNIKVQQLGVHRIKDEYHRELQRLKQLVKQKEEVIGQLQKEICIARDNLELVWKVTDADNKKVKRALKKCEDTQHVET